MSVLGVLLFTLLVAGGAQGEAASEPSCTAVEDFGACQGNTDNFCPLNIPCQCRKQKPFCRCDYYREGWREFWYMGPKCDYLWSTLDLILVAVLPAVSLAFVVAVICQCVYYCKERQARKQTNSPYHEAHHNPAFTRELPGSPRQMYEEQPRAAWAGLPKPALRRQDFDDLPGQSPSDNFSPMHSQPSRRPEYLSSQQPQQYDRFAYPGSNMSYAAGRQYPRY